MRLHQQRRTLQAGVGLQARGRDHRHLAPAIEPGTHPRGQVAGLLRLPVDRWRDRAGRSRGRQSCLGAHGDDLQRIARGESEATRVGGAKARLQRGEIGAADIERRLRLTFAQFMDDRHLDGG